MPIFDLSNYAFSYQSIPNILVACLVFGLGLFTLIRERYTLVAITFFLLTVAQMGWQFAIAVSYFVVNLATAKYWINITLFFVFCIPFCAYFFNLAVVQQVHRYRYWL